MELFSIRLLLLLVQSVLWLTADSCGSQGLVRIRLSNTSSGFIHPDDSPYKVNTKCTWFIEGDSTTAYMKLKFNFFSTECLWDYLHIFNGDSIYSPKVAAFSGNILPKETTPTISSGSGQGSGDRDDQSLIYSLTSNNEIILSINGPHLLFHFFSDEAENDVGFNITYWVSTCIANCSNNGACDETRGTCTCDNEWTGEYCQYPSCPNNCNSHGKCTGGQCHCERLYTGVDCSIVKSHTHWSEQYMNNIDVTGRAGHSAVLWRGYMWVFGGYQFDETTALGRVVTMTTSESERQDENSTQLIRYNLMKGQWEHVNINSSDNNNTAAARPRSRYGHTAVVYEDSMYIYGGAILPSEEITNELWKFDFLSLTWTEIESCQNGNESYCPLGVKYHSANVIGDTMFIFYGYSIIEDIVNIVQEFNLINETWPHPPIESGSTHYGRMAHSSVYVQELELVLLYGGEFRGRHESSDLVIYDPVTHHWSQLSKGPHPQAFHSSVLMGGALVTFAGYNNKSCFSSRLIIYDIVHNQWRQLTPPGLPGNASRYSYSAVAPNNTLLIYGGFKGEAYNDILMLARGECRLLLDVEACMNSLCYWNNDSSLCEDIILTDNDTYCHLILNCSKCLSTDDCQWTDDKCIYNSTFNSSVNITSMVCTTPMDSCSRYRHCQTCIAHRGCNWEGGACKNTNDTSFISMLSCPTTQCSRHTKCSSCSSSSCLWCASLNTCIPGANYHFLFPFGQCLGWERIARECNDEQCTSHNTCLQCQKEPGCGWCRDPADTGLGSCNRGGFLTSLNNSFCSDSSHWFFDTCPLCNCNGHSSCVNKSICISCQDNTQGTNCENCVDGYYGEPVNGNMCSACDCNGYNTVCDNVRGNCTCLDAGVTGPHCTACRATENYNGNASNICYYPVTVGFIYTFISRANESQAFYSARPTSGNRLNVQFEIADNPSQSSINIQFFLGRISQNYQLLYNLSDVITLSGSNSYSQTYRPFSPDLSDNSSQLFSFARPFIQESEAFLWLLGNSSSQSYTRNLWDGDIALIIYVFNLQPLIRYRITVDQTDLIFLVYFFVTFITCFTVLLTVFLLGWYIKRKLEIRALMRAQHIEMQRRVRRPFARIKAITATPTTEFKQNASYVAVETMNDTKAAILTLLVRFPYDRSTGHPKPNRTGVCFGSTLVRMNPPKKRKVGINKNNHNLSSNT